MIELLVQSSALVSQRLEFNRPGFFSRDRCGTPFKEVVMGFVGQRRHIVERRAITEKQDISRICIERGGEVDSFSLKRRGILILFSPSFST